MGLSGFRYHEAEEVLRRLPDTLFFSLYRLTVPFPAPVHALADFPKVAPAAGVTDVLLTFLNFSVGVLGVAADASVAPVPGARPDISLWPVLDRWGIRAHATLYRGGGLFPDTTPDVLLALARRCATVFTSAPEVFDVLPDAVATVVPVPGDFSAWQPHPDDGPHDLRLVFVGDDRPRRGLPPCSTPWPTSGPGSPSMSSGPTSDGAGWPRSGPSPTGGWPGGAREVLWGADVVVGARHQRSPGGQIRRHRHGQQLQRPRPGWRCCASLLPGRAATPTAGIPDPARRALHPPRPQAGHAPPWSTPCGCGEGRPAERRAIARRGPGCRCTEVRDVAPIREKPASARISLYGDAKVNGASQ